MQENSPAVLLVDDDENVLHALSRALHRQPYRLLTARSADEAMWIMKTRPVDVLVTDECMPGMSGTELLEWSARLCPQAMRIVLTGRLDAAIAIRAINEGRVFYFFTKPCDEMQLAIAIRKAMEHKNLLEENARLVEVERRHVEAWVRRTEAVRQLHAKILREVREPLETIRCEYSTIEKCEPAFDGKTLLRQIGRALDALATLEATVDMLCEEPTTVLTASTNAAAAS